MARQKQSLEIKENTYMKMKESAENYLETILILNKRVGSVKSIDIVRELNYSKPSVSVAMKNLRNAGYINIDDNGYITLSETGMAIANKIYERHNILADMFIRLGVESAIAIEDACKIEHIISDESFEAIKKHLNK